MISKLLVREPSQRLGAGRVGSNNDFDALKRHPFLKGLDFDKVFLLPSPLQSKKYKRSTLMQKLIEENQKADAI